MRQGVEPLSISCSVRMSGFDRISLRMHIHIYIYADVTVLFTQELSFLLLYYLYCLCKSVQRSLLQCACRSESESGCKGKEFFVYPPNFSGSFFSMTSSEEGHEGSPPGLRCLHHVIQAPLPFRKRVQK